MITELACQPRFAKSLFRFAADSGNEDHACSFGEFKDRPQQTVLRFANGELRCMHAYGNATGAGGAIIPRQRRLPAFV
jgi:hypothetical protein